jgi:membrane protease YdiL (CAAX protease family)
MDEKPDPYVSPEDLVEAQLVAEGQLGDKPATPWGFWATIGFSIVVLGVFVAIQTAVIMPFVFAEMRRQPGVSPQALTENLESNGLLLALATVISTPACIALTVLFASLRKPTSVRRYLGLNPVSPRTLLVWCLAVVLFMLLSDGLTYLLAREVVPTQMVEAYRTAGFLPLLWLAIIGLAPLFEEVFFRGFLFSGIRHCWLGGPGAIVITALTWAGIHLQYDIYQVSVIFAGGLLLGIARLKSSSLCPTVAMHAIWNVIAMVETAFVAAD